MLGCGTNTWNGQHVIRPRCYCQPQFHNTPHEAISVGLAGIALGAPRIGRTRYQCFVVGSPSVENTYSSQRSCGWNHLKVNRRLWLSLLHEHNWRRSSRSMPNKHVQVVGPWIGSCSKGRWCYMWKKGTFRKTCRSYLILMKRLNSVSIWSLLY